MKAKIMLAALMALLSLTSLSAQTRQEIIESVKLMENPSTPCNQGAEPFTKFILQFSTDQSFMESRLKLTEAQATEYANLLTPSNFVAVEPEPRNDDEWYQQWDELQRNSVYLSCGWVDSFTEHIFEFKRIGEKWYLAKIVTDNN